MNRQRVNVCANGNALPGTRALNDRHDTAGILKTCRFQAEAMERFFQKFPRPALLAAYLGMTMQLAAHLLDKGHNLGKLLLPIRQLHSASLLSSIMLSSTVTIFPCS